MSSSTLLLPPRDRRATPHLVPKGRLQAPDEALFAIRQLYLPLYQYLCETTGSTPSPSHSISMPRFKVLDDGQFLELMTDVSDEMWRRDPEKQGSPAHEPFLGPQRFFSEGRNESRHTLSSLKNEWLVTLIKDVWTEARRRWPEFKADEAHAKVPARDSRDQSEGDQGVDMVDLNDLQSSVAPSSAMQHLHPSSTRHAHESRGYRSEGSASDEETALLADEEQTKPGWLEAAEAKVKAHLGPGRSSHDFAHADRVRRQALGLARLQQSKSESVDARVVELAALFICAANDPKRPIHDPKELVLQFRAEHRDCLDQEQLEAVIRITRATGLKKEERRKRERRESDWHRTCLELHCVQDADKLEMLGAFGVLRTTATYGTTHRPLFEPSHEQTDAAGRAPGSAVKHLLEKERLLGLMRTREGRKAATHRWNRMKAFARAAEDEYSMRDLAE